MYATRQPANFGLKAFWVLPTLDCTGKASQWLRAAPYSLQDRVVLPLHIARQRSSASPEGRMFQL